MKKKANSENWEVLIDGVECESTDIFEQVEKINSLLDGAKITEKEAERRISELEERDEEFGLEISVIRKDNIHGHESWGWGDETKIILWSSGDTSNEMSTNNILWCRKVAELLCDSMNKNNM